MLWNYIHTHLIHYILKKKTPPNNNILWKIEFKFEICCIMGNEYETAIALEKKNKS